MGSAARPVDPARELQPRGRRDMDACASSRHGGGDARPDGPALSVLTDCYPFSNNIPAMAAYGNSTIAAAQRHWRRVGAKAATGAAPGCIAEVVTVVMRGLPRAQESATTQSSGEAMLKHAGTWFFEQIASYGTKACDIEAGPTCKQAATLRREALTLGRRQQMQGVADTGRTAIAGVGTSQPDDRSRQRRSGVSRYCLGRAPCARAATQRAEHGVAP
jgi:hypothetical protein